MTSSAPSSIMIIRINIESRESCTFSADDLPLVLKSHNVLSVEILTDQLTSHFDFYFQPDVNPVEQIREFVTRAKTGAMTISKFPSVLNCKAHIFTNGTDIEFVILEEEKTCDMKITLPLAMCMSEFEKLIG